MEKEKDTVSLHYTFCLSYVFGGDTDALTLYDNFFINTRIIFY